MKRLYKNFKANGWTTEGARTMVAHVGRENDYVTKYMFGTHVDASNALRNVGLISWQGARYTALMKFLKSQGCIDASNKIKPGWATLDAQCKFMNIELKSSYTSAYKALTTAGLTYDNNIEDVISRKYVGWAKGGSSNGKFTKRDSDKALAKMRGYYNTIKNLTKEDG
jgi:hypothetical protein